jgi:uncharacterized protein with HEPN domain
MGCDRGDGGAAVSRSPEERLRDVLEAVAAVEDHLTHGTLHEGMVFDAVRMRLIEIGEATKALRTLRPDLLATEPEIDWTGVMRMRDWTAHRDFDTAFAVVEQTVLHDLAPLAAAVRRLLDRL